MYVKGVFSQMLDNSDPRLRMVQPGDEVFDHEDAIWNEAIEAAAALVLDFDTYYEIIALKQKGRIAT
jgi:hypothetical protein